MQWEVNQVIEIVSLLISLTESLHPLDSKRLLDSVAEMETSANSLLEAAKGTNISALQPQTLVNLQERYR